MGSCLDVVTKFLRGPGEPVQLARSRRSSAANFGLHPLTLVLMPRRTEGPVTKRQDRAGDADTSHGGEKPTGRSCPAFAGCLSVSEKCRLSSRRTGWATACRCTQCASHARPLGEAELLQTVRDVCVRLKAPE